MKTRSAKNKGKRLCNKVRERLLKKSYKDPRYDVRWTFEDGDIKSTISGEGGRDIQLSPFAETLIPFDIECKNTETASPWEWMKQAKANTKPGRKPLVVFTRNREGDVYAMIRFDDLLSLL